MTSWAIFVELALVPQSYVVKTWFITCNVVAVLRILSSWELNLLHCATLTLADVNAPSLCSRPRSHPPTPQNDASPYVEKWLKRCRLIRRAIYPPSAPAPSPPPPPPPRGGTASLAPGSVTGGEATAPAALTTSSAAAASLSASQVSVANGGRGEGAERRGVSVSNGHSGAPRGSSGGGGVGVPGTAASVPARARRLVWRGVVDGLLLSLLRGFSHAKRCSTEGRALMSMDLQALVLGLEDPAAAQAAKAHVHAYVNAFYFGDEDLHKWIKVRGE